MTGRTTPRGEARDPREHATAHRTTPTGAARTDTGHRDGQRPHAVLDGLRRHPVRSGLRRPAIRDGLRRHTVRVALAALAAAVVTTPFVMAWRYDVQRRAVSAQAPAPATGAFARPRLGAVAHASAPVVLAYHDIHPRPSDDYTLTPGQLDAQLTALAAAGYRTLSTREFVHYLTTGHTPAPRTVYLTFDDGTRGLWGYADQILAKHKMRAAAYLITGRVGTHRPYYLSWAEIDRMSRSGRWDFQDHTHLGHAKVPVDAAGRPGAVLANRRWLKDEQRLETEKEYRTRVRDDLDRSLRTFAGHGLPAPRLFAYPFSETATPTNLADRKTSVLDQELRSRFVATLTNTSTRPLPAGARAAAAAQVQRLEILRTTTRSAFLRALRTWTSLSPGDVPEPLRTPWQWSPTGAPPGTGPAALTGRGVGNATYASAVHLPMATANWGTYRLTATVDRLHGSATSVSVEVGHGSLHPCVVTVSAAGVRVTERPDQGRERVTVRRLEPAARHRLTLDVTPRAVRVTVDEVSFSARSTDRPEPARTNGGFSLAVRNEARASTAWPRFASLRLHP